MGGNQVRVAAAAVALGFVIALVLGVTGVSGNAAYSAGTTLTILSGDVLVRHGASDFAVASDGEVLSEGDAIRTGADGRAVLTYFEGSSVTIEPATELAIDSANTTADGGTIVLMTQTVGRTWHVVTKLIAGSSKYEVRTPASTASVRGTKFQVDADTTTTTVSTTEGTVMAQVPDPGQNGAAVDVPVTAGTAQTQPRNAPPAPTKTAPEPERKVTVTVGASNTLIVDPLGRANGVTKDGKVVAQTPGAQVKRDGDKIVVTLPNVPDGKLAARVDKKDDHDDGDVTVETKVEENGRSVVVDDTAKAGASNKKTAGFEVKREADGTLDGRALTEAEKKTLPAAKTANPLPATRTARTASPTPTPRATLPGTRPSLTSARPSPSPSVSNGTAPRDRSTLAPRTPSPTEQKANFRKTLALPRLPTSKPQGTRHP